MSRHIYHIMIVITTATVSQLSAYAYAQAILMFSSRIALSSEARLRQCTRHRGDPPSASPMNGAGQHNNRVVLFIRTQSQGIRARTTSLLMIVLYHNSISTLSCKLTSLALLAHFLYLEANDGALEDLSKELT